MKSIISMAAAAAFFFVAPGVCFALWDVEIVSKERVKELGVEIRSTAAGANHVRIELEFGLGGELRNFSEVELRFGEGDNFVLAAALREDRSEPGRVAVSFTANAAQLEELSLRVMVPFRDGGAGGTTHEFRVKDFVDVERRN